MSSSKLRLRSKIAMVELSALPLVFPTPSWTWLASSMLVGYHWFKHRRTVLMMQVPLDLMMAWHRPVLNW